MDAGQKKISGSVTFLPSWSTHVIGSLEYKCSPTGPSDLSPLTSFTHVFGFRTCPIIAIKPRCGARLRHTCTPRHQCRLLRLCANQGRCLSSPKYVYHVQDTASRLVTPCSHHSASLATPSSALTLVDVNIFRHEFITIFRLSETKTLHPADIAIIEPINDYHVLYEEGSGTVFVARELMDRMRKMTEKPLPPRTRSSRYRRHLTPRQQ